MPFAEVVSEQPVARRRQRRQVGRRAAADKKPARLPGHPEDLAQPVDGDQFYLGSGGPLKPRACKNVESRGQCVCHRPDETAGTGDKGKESRMIQVHDPGEYLLFNESQDLVRIGSRFRERLPEDPVEL